MRCVTLHFHEVIHQGLLTTAFGGSIVTADQEGNSVSCKVLLVVAPLGMSDFPDFTEKVSPEHYSLNDVDGKTSEIVNFLHHLYS